MWTTFLLKLGGALLSIFATANIADWFFSGSKWAHKYYAAFPEIWRPLGEHAGRGEEGRVIRSAIFLGFEFAFAFVLFYLFFQPGVVFSSPLTRGLAVGLILWLLIPVPLLLTQHLFIKYHKVSTLGHLATWYVKLTAASLIMAFMF